jgi:hypothetical protein
MFETLVVIDIIIAIVRIIIIAAVAATAALKLFLFLLIPLDDSSLHLRSLPTFETLIKLELRKRKAVVA